MNDYTLGQRVRFTHQLVRASVSGYHIPVIEKYGDREVEHKRFINKKWMPIGYGKTLDGMVIGKRTLANGHSRWESDYESWSDSGYYQFDRAESFTAWLVAFDMRRKPVLVLPEHIEAQP